MCGSIGVLIKHSTSTSTRLSKTNATFCVTSELYTLQALLPPPATNLTTSNLISSVVSALSNTTIEKQLACTDCVADIYATIKLSPALAAANVSFAAVEQELDGLCGADFAGTITKSDVEIATGPLASATASSTSTSNRESSGAERTAAAAAAGLSLAGALAFVGSTIVLGGLGVFI